MTTRLHFLGANRQVTGSRYLLETPKLRVLIDCGMFQEREFLGRNWEPSPVPADSIDCLLLTHAHLDHVGLIPRLVAQGYDGPIITVEPSVDLAEIILLDAGRIQEEDVSYKQKRHQKEGRRGRYPAVPLYTASDAKKAIPLFRGVRFDEAIELSPEVSVTFHEAGHILGSAFLNIRVNDNSKPMQIVFSGDVGQWDKPLVNDPVLLDQADYVVMESTYGDRKHKDVGPVEDQLGKVINDTVERGGNIVIPTFAVERAQELVYHLGKLRKDNRIPDLQVFLDSPMAIRVTDVFHRHCKYLDEETRCRVEAKADALDYPGLHFVSTGKESRALNHRGGSNIILAGSGMCTGGRIKHHLRQNLTRPESTILFVGYQAVGTLGREIVGGAADVRIHGQRWPVRAQIAQIYGLSAHGDSDDLIRWLEGCKHPPKQVFLTHGDEQAATSLGQIIKDRLSWEVSVPAYKEVVDLET